jgi:hypothetical protein
MFIFCHSLTNKILLSILLTGLAASAAAHTYFFGVSELNLNNTNKHIEIIHQFTAHDIENTIAENKQTHFSPEHPKYDLYIQEYFEKHFTLKHTNNKVKLHWLGFEIKRGQIFAYQESLSANTLDNLVVKNTILIDTYAKQINTLNYQDLTLLPKRKLQGSLTFNSHQQLGKIKALPSQINNGANKL